MTRTRADVWTLTDSEGTWPAALSAYARGVEAMRALDPPSGRPTKRLGWQFMAAMHGRAAADGSADLSNPLWSKCQHGSWYFLPWHRMYLAAFEAIVQHFLEDDRWSLPYWYAVDPDRRDSAVLPPAFRDADPSNPLFTTHRSRLANRGDRLPDVSRSVIDALGAELFSTDTGISSFGGGERSSPSFFGDEMGALEDTPHGLVHVLVGNDVDPVTGVTTRAGWMGSFFTAGLDPVFWLHHANIDRLWQVWLEADASHQNPPRNDPAWFKTKFRFPSPGGGTRTWRVGDVLDPTVLGYTYESLSVPSALAGLGPAVPVGGGGQEDTPGGGTPRRMGARRPAQVIGVSDDVPLGEGRPVQVSLSPPQDTGHGEADVPVPERVYLRLEGITGTAAAPAYDVYVNLPEGMAGQERPDLRAGTMATFGLAEASRRDDAHDGTGLTKVFDVTRVRGALTDEGRWDPDRIDVTFVPVVPPAPAAEDEETEAAEAAPMPPDIRAARVVVLSA